MYNVSFPFTSNKASWLFVGQVLDMEENPIDISACSMAFAVREKTTAASVWKRQPKTAKSPTSTSARFAGFLPAKKWAGCALALMKPD